MNSLVTALIFHSIILHVVSSQGNFGPNCSDGTDTVNCKNAECPANTIGTYPNCECTETNFDYSIDLNYCFRVCPENSTGYWPNCVCNERFAKFDKEYFECRICPADSENSSMYPNCDCSKFGTYNMYLNQCQRCVEAAGIHPNCVCNDTLAKYNAKTNICEYCPDDSTGIIPNCKCNNDRTVYDAEVNYCSESLYDMIVCPNENLFKNEYCSYCSSVDCDCKGYTYIKNCSMCCSCPHGSWGDYPNCVCEEPFQYNNLINQCMECPAHESEGIYPNCICQNGLFSISEHRCRTCPQNSSGFYPNCECINEEYTFSAYINECYIECPDDAEDIHPQCRCHDPNFYYDINERVCKSNVGRKCPHLSIGIGPDCLCVEEHYKFDKKFWLCYDETKRISQTITPIAQCPDAIKKWPQCDDSIQRNALLSLVG